jgi:hypothetical protein
MGYNSEVSLTLKNDDFNALLESARKEGEDVFDFIKHTEIRRNEKYTTIYWDWVKWYDSFPEVRFIETFKSGVNHVFHEIGENNTDYEQSTNMDESCYDMYGCACFIRKIDVTGAGEEIKIE